MNNRNPTWNDGAGPGGVGRSRLRLAAAALAVAFAGVFAVPTIADAATLVSNTGQTTEENYSIEAGETESQGFHTGDNVAGYSLTAIKLDIFRTTSLENLSSLKVSLRAKGSGNHPASADLAIFTNPSIATLQSTGIKTFSLTSPYTLTADTDYYIVVSVSTGIVFSWDYTESTSEDSGPAAGWSIHDDSVYLTSTNTWDTNGYVYKIAVDATAITPPAVRAPTPTVRSCTHAPGEEVWRTTMTVGEATVSGKTAVGYSGASNFFGSLSQTTFRYRGVTTFVRQITNFDGTLIFNLGRRSGTVPDDGLGLLGLGTFTLQLGNTCIAIANPGTETRFEFTDHGLSWSSGDRIPVKLTRARDWQRGDDERFSSTSAPNASGLQTSGAFATGFRLLGRNFNVSAGFVLENVQIEYLDEHGRAFSAQICETDRNYVPGSECTDLIPPSSFPSVSGSERPLLSFRAPAGGIFLSRKGRYAVVLNTGGNVVRLARKFHERCQVKA